MELALALNSNWENGETTWVPKYQEDVEALDLLASHGWSLANAITLSKDILPYRDYILGSRGEFTVAKDQNVRLLSGWSSDRSACYLASGRPVLAEDTGFSDFLPIGKGLIAFQNVEEAIEGVKQIQADYPLHMRKARELAEEYLDSRRCLSAMLAACTQPALLHLLKKSKLGLSNARIFDFVATVGR